MSEDWVDDLPHEAPRLAAMANARMMNDELRALIRLEAEHAEASEFPAVAELPEGWAVYEGGDHDGWFCVSPEQLREFAAEKWDEGRWWWFTGDESAARGANPYRAEAS